jgi:hypothetical protein
MEDCPLHMLLSFRADLLKTLATGFKTSEALWAPEYPQEGFLFRPIVSTIGACIYCLSECLGELCASCEELYRFCPRAGLTLGRTQ